MKVHSKLNLRHSHYGCDAKVGEYASKDIMNLVFKSPDFPLLQYIASSPKVISADEVYYCRVDHDADYDEMEQVGNVAKLDLCSEDFFSRIVCT